MKRIKSVIDKSKFEMLDVNTLKMIIGGEIQENQKFSTLSNVISKTDTTAENGIIQEID